MDGGRALWEMMEIPLLALDGGDDYGRHSPEGKHRCAPLPLAVIDSGESYLQSFVQ